MKDIGKVVFAFGGAVLVLSRQLERRYPKTAPRLKPDELLASGIDTGITVALASPEYGYAALRQVRSTAEIAEGIERYRAWMQAHPISEVPA